MIPRRADGAPLRIGHKGAAALAPENTLRSFERALELGVDAIEFDVLDLEDGSLVLAHSDDLLEVSHGAAAGRVRTLPLAALREVCPDLPTLDDALEFVAARDVVAHVDVKWTGYERAVAEAIERHGLVGRSLVSTCHAESLRVLADASPKITRGLTYPYDRLRISTRRALAPAVAAGMHALRRTAPLRIGRLLDRARASVAVLNHVLVTPEAVARCHRRGAPVVAWTVDTEADLRRVVAAGVDAVVTNDPRIFEATICTS